MDSPVANLFFKRLYHYCNLPRRPLHVCQFSPTSPTRHTQLRRHKGTYSQLRKDAAQKREARDEEVKDEIRKNEATGKLELPKGYLTRKDVDRMSWQPRQDILPPNVAEELDNYETLTAEQQRQKNRRPKRSKMLMRDFIEDSLYNPHYGYFANQATIFNPGNPFNFNAMRSDLEFIGILRERYRDFEDKLDKDGVNETRQLWHTPTELFRPHYAEAMARYLIANYKISSFPYHDLIIYELGAGNGTFMLNVLDYIRDTDPDVYDRTKYKVIEISSNLAKLQQKRLEGTIGDQGHASRVEIVNKSILAWDTYVSAPCFVVCLEVIDNFAHDLIRYNIRTQQHEQASAAITTKGELYTHWAPHLDPLAEKYLDVRHAACAFNHRRPLTKRLRDMWPFRRKGEQIYTNQEYIPTRLLQFFTILHSYFPSHRLLLSDFHTLPDTCSPSTLNAPVVQTRFQRNTVPVRTPLVYQGYFDIFFPTDFRVMESIYRAITGKLTRASSHEEFMARWADIEACRCVDGEVPLLNWYKNAGVMTTV